MQREACRVGSLIVGVHLGNCTRVVSDEGLQQLFRLALELNRDRVGPEACEQVGVSVSS